ncbi:MAG TPA: hypothetical protein PK699_01495 [bacterium]|nr:hypothetical protein [bacterium]HPO81353.1 hypothetical protein [bacterium]
MTERLNEDLEVVDVINVQELGPEISEDIAGYELVFFIDAGIDQENNYEIKEIIPLYKNPIFSHHISPEMILAITKELFGVSPAAYLVSVRGYSFDFGFEITREAQENSEKAIDRIKEICMNWLSQKR